VGLHEGSLYKEKEMELTRKNWLMVREFIEELENKIHAWYSIPGQSMGGCLRVQLDDGNLDNDQMDDGLREVNKIRDQHVRGLGVAIINMILDVPEDIRDIIVDPLFHREWKHNGDEVL
jgi:hypothetical protein